MKRIRKIRNMRELDLVIENQKNQQIFHEKNLIGSSAQVLNSITDKFQNLAFELGSELISQIILSFRKKK